MNFDYAALASKSAALLSKFGRDVTRRRVTRGAYDTSQGSAANAGQADATFKGALLDFGTREVDGTLVKSTDKKLLLEASGAPLASDTFLVGGLEYAVVSVKEISPAGTPVLYEVQLRK